MTKTSHRRNSAIVCRLAIFLPLLALTTPVALGLESTPASGHICSGCASCAPLAVSVPKAIAHTCIDPLHRAGHPETQGTFAKPSLNRHYSFGYVGGGGAFRGEPRFADEGTWGVDYSGILYKKQIWLPWLHGHREPRHDGSYQTDGPRLLEQ